MYLENQYDLIIVGGGCAGLSLAVRLSQLGKQCPKTLIIEQRAEYSNDRTWCFWYTKDTRFADLATYTWSHCVVKTEGESIEVNCQNTPYCMLPAITFYKYALDEISKNSRIEILLNTTMTQSPTKFQSNWQISVLDNTYCTNLVVDTRPVKQPKSSDAILWQSFYGAEIVCEEDVFDAKKVVLMDFVKDMNSSVCFRYILPTTSKKALVEFTVFASEPIACKSLEKELDNAIAKYTINKPYVVLRNEYGVLPMGYLQNKSGKDKSYSYVGLFSGAARPSSGYAFQRIQCWAEVCARSISERNILKTHSADSIVQHKMDRLFLQVIRYHFLEAPFIFRQLFEFCRTDRVIRFLSDQATLIDFYMIVMSLPARPFLRQMLNNLKKVFIHYVSKKTY